MNRAVPARKSDPAADFRRSNIQAAVVIGVIAVIFGVLVGYFNPLLNHAASVEGVAVDVLFSVMLAVASAIFVVVEGGIIYSLIKYRSRREDDEDEVIPVHEHRGLEILWTAVPAALVTATALSSYFVLTTIETPARNPVTVEVTARQFAWQFYYPSLDVTSSELHIPVGQQVLVKLHSADVIHQFWIPAFRVKRDVMPDRVTELRFTAKQAGTFPIVCTKICGVGHANMRSTVIAEAPDAYEAWIAGQANGGTAPGGGTDEMAKGRQVFAINGCNACHKLNDAKANGNVGPDLDGIGTKATQRLGAGYTGKAKTAEEYIQESIVDPNAYVVQGFQPNIMPQTFGKQISEADLNTLVKYLAAQK